jgi:5-(carboxyamino)imidazole ribonucleotide synthase
MKIGILGGGQLARMLIEAGSQFGFDFLIYSTEKNSPAGRICEKEYFGKWDDFDELDKFTEKSDVITLENEFIDYKVIEHIESKGGKVKPGSAVVKTIQDKLIQKNFLKKAGAPVAVFCEINYIEDIREFCGRYGFPVILKSRTMGYDGKGNYLIASEKDIETAYTELRERGKLMAEQFIDFDFEIAIQAVRNAEGEIRFYPIVETVQKNHICNLVRAPHYVPLELSNYLHQVTAKILNELDYKGVMGIEFFVTGDELLINELAPRVHNTGHYTIEACEVSQFENHIRAIAGYPLGSTKMKSKNAVMINILGMRNDDTGSVDLSRVLEMENTYPHIYGKEKIRTGRKMGHITVLSDSIEKAEIAANEARKLIDI